MNQKTWPLRDLQEEQGNYCLVLNTWTFPRAFMHIDNAVAEFPIRLLETGKETRSFQDLMLPQILLLLPSSWFSIMGKMEWAVQNLRQSTFQSSEGGVIRTMTLHGFAQCWISTISSPITYSRQLTDELFFTHTWRFFYNPDWCGGWCTIPSLSFLWWWSRIKGGEDTSLLMQTFLRREIRQWYHSKRLSGHVGISSNILHAFLHHSWILYYASSVPGRKWERDILTPASLSLVVREWDSHLEEKAMSCGAVFFLCGSLWDGAADSVTVWFSQTNNAVDSYACHTAGLCWSCGFIYSPTNSLHFTRSWNHGPKTGRNVWTCTFLYYVVIFLNFSPFEQETESVERHSLSAASRGSVLLP